MTDNNIETLNYKKANHLLELLYADKISPLVNHLSYILSSSVIHYKPLTRTRYQPVVFRLSFCNLIFYGLPHPQKTTKTKRNSHFQSRHIIKFGLVGLGKGRKTVQIDSQPAGLKPPNTHNARTSFCLSNIKPTLWMVNGTNALLFAQSI